MNPDEFLNQLNLQSGAIAISITLIALALILLLNRKRLLVGFREWRIQRILKRIGSEQIRNLVCPDGLDGFYDIDRLALTQNAILVISYKPYVGNIYCAEHISEWTQIIGRQSFNFENPLFELENQLASLRLLTGNVALHGYLFFNHSAVFPKGHPDSVLHPGNIPDHFLAANSSPPRSEILAAWEILKTCKNEGPANNRVGVNT